MSLTLNVLEVILVGLRIGASIVSVVSGEACGPLTHLFIDEVNFDLFRFVPCTSWLPHEK